MVVDAATGPRSVRELIQQAKANPGRVNFGAGTVATQLIGEQIKAKLGIDGEGGSQTQANWHFKERQVNSLLKAPQRRHFGQEQRTAKQVSRRHCFPEGHRQTDLEHVAAKEKNRFHFQKTTLNKYQFDLLIGKSLKQPVQPTEMTRVERGGSHVSELSRPFLKAEKRLSSAQKQNELRGSLVLS